MPHNFVKKNRFPIIVFVSLSLISLACAAFLYRPGKRSAQTRSEASVNTPFRQNNPPLDNKNPGPASPRITAFSGKDADPRPATDQPSRLPSDQPKATGVPDASSSPAMNTSTPIQTQNTIPVSLAIADKNFSANVPARSSVYDLMIILSQKNELTFSGKNYSGMGFFVEEINGLKNDPSSGKYWIYYVNSQTANLGASNHILKPGDNIMWKYEIPNF